MPAGSDHTSDLHLEWAGLKATRQALDAAIEQWLVEITPEFLTSTIRYAKTRGVQRVRPVWQALTYFSYHQTYYQIPTIKHITEGW